MLKQTLDQDLKQAMLSGDKSLAELLRGLKSAILYEEVAKGIREKGLSDDEIITVLSKEAKKRQESAELYAKGGDSKREQAELDEKKIIEKYLPEQISTEQIEKLIDEAESQIGTTNQQNFGQIIGWVKQKTSGTADGAKIAELVRRRVDK